MKILLLATATPHSPLTHSIASLGRQLVRRGHSVSMMAPSADKYSKWQADRPADLDGIRMIYPFQFHTKSQLFNLLPYIAHAGLLVLLQRVDIAYVYKPTPANVVGVLARWFTRARLILHVDDLDAEVMRAQGTPMPLWLLVEACERLVAANADAVVTASRLLEREYKARLAHTPILRLPNGVDPAKFPIAPKPGPDRVPRLVFFGILGRTRILAPLLEALPQVVAQIGTDLVQAEILGDGPCRSELEVLAKKLGIADNVKFRGWTSYDQLQTYTAAGDIGICIMPQERTTAACSNQKVFQYMSLGLPTIVSDVGDLPLYVEDGAAGVVVPCGDTNALSGAIVALLKDPARRKKLAVRARELAETRYSWSILGGQLEIFLRGAL